MRGSWQGEMFGLAIDSACAIEGCEPAGLPPGLAITSIEIASRRALREAWPANARALAWHRGPSGRPVAEVLEHARAGYLLPAPGFGLFQVSSGGERVRAAPNRLAPWRWQRYLLGRVLPFAAVLRGLEPLHASAVALPEGVVVIAGEAGAGKTSLAAALMLRGLRFVADDVVALTAGDDGAQAHSAAGLLWLRHPTLDRLGEDALGRLGRPIGRDREGVRVAAAPEPSPRPVLALCLLEPAARSRRVQAPAAIAPDPRRLLASTFNTILADPDRLERQLDVCARLARQARVLRLAVPEGADPRAVAERLLEGL